MCNKCYFIQSRGDGERDYSKSKMDADVVKEKLVQGLAVACFIPYYCVVFLASLLLAGLGIVVALLWTIGRSIINLLGLGFQRK